MRKVLRTAAFAFLAMLATACTDEMAGPTADAPQDQPETRSLAVPPNFSVASTDLLAGLGYCGTQHVARMMSGKSQAGSVTVRNDAQNVYVTYRTTGSNFISDTRMYVARDPNKIPRNKNGFGDPWAFDYVGEHEPAITSYTYTVPLSDYNLKAGEEISIAAMAGIVYPVSRNWSGRWEWQVVWGEGERIHPKRKQEQFIRYRIVACGPTTPTDTTPTPPDTTPTPPTLGTGRVTITFDDARESAFTIGFQVLREFGLRGNIAVNALPIIQSWTTYMNKAQLDSVHNAGWAVVNHSYTHPQLDTVSPAVLESEIRDNKLWIEQNGYRGSNIFIVPFHAWGAREKEVIRRYASAARGLSVTQFGPTDSLATYPPVTDPYALTGLEPEAAAPWTTAAGRARTIALAERAIREGKFLEIFFHEIPSGNTQADIDSRAGFRTLIQELSRLKVSIQTYSELFPAPTLAGR